MLAVEPAEQGYNASYIYCDEETMYIARDQMKLLEGRLPQKEDEVVVSRYFLSNYGSDAGIGEKVMLTGYIHRQLSHNQGDKWSMRFSLRGSL